MVFAGLVYLLTILIFYKILLILKTCVFIKADCNYLKKICFHVLNFQVLSSKLIPVEGTMQFDSHFSDEFLSCGGLSILISLLHRESLPHDMDYEVRQSIYLIVLQLLR